LHVSGGTEENHKKPVRATSFDPNWESLDFAKMTSESKIIPYNVLSASFLPTDINSIWHSRGKALPSTYSGFVFTYRTPKHFNSYLQSQILAELAY
jgi:hypothetical protein